MAQAGEGAGGRRRAEQHLAAAFAVWSAVLLAAPFISLPAPRALWWGAGAAVLVGVFPLLLVTHLSRRNDLRGNLGLGALPPAVAGAAALGYIVLRVLLWTGGPLVLAAVVYAMLADCLLLLFLGRAVRIPWQGLSYGSAAVILPVLAVNLQNGPAGSPAAGILILLLLVLGWSFAAIDPRRRIPSVVSVLAGAAAGGGVFLWLIPYSV